MASTDLKLKSGIDANNDILTDGKLTFTNNILKVVTPGNLAILPSHNGKIIYYNYNYYATSVTNLEIEFQTNDSFLPIGFQVSFIQGGSALMDFPTNAGLTYQTPSRSTSQQSAVPPRTQYSLMTVLKISTSKYLFFGDVGADQSG